MAERRQIEHGLEVAFRPFCALSRSHVTLCCLVNLPIGVFEDEREKLVGVVSNCCIGLFGGRIRFFLYREFIQQRRLEPRKRLNTDFRLLYSVSSREDKGDREGILRTHPIP